jgi:hypothetical protein
MAMARDASYSRQEPSGAASRAEAAGGQTRKRERLEDRALAALLSQPTIVQAATTAGVSESTLLRWLAEPSFKARYRDARRQVVEHAVSSLQQATGQAVETLVEITGNIASPPAARVSAAKTILDFAVKGVELVDLAERVEQLEQAADVVKEKHRP